MTFFPSTFRKVNSFIIPDDHNIRRKYQQPLSIYTDWILEGNWYKWQVCVITSLLSYSKACPTIVLSANITNHKPTLAGRFDGEGGGGGEIMLCIDYDLFVIAVKSRFV